jgi:ubiquinone/menaquinone biosynthesis C-methylase UbiE
MAEGVIIGSRLRSWLQNPYRVLSNIGLARGHVFLDVGCGRGFLTTPAARVVGPEGLVYAVDVSREYLRELQRLVQKLKLDNVRVVENAAERLDDIPDNSVDRAVMMLSLHHFKDRIQAFRNVRKVLRDDGALYIFDPIASRMLGHGTNPNKILQELAETGFKPIGLRKGLLFWTVTVLPS